MSGGSAVSRPRRARSDLTDHDLASATVDTNVSTRADRKFVNYSPERLKAGPYDAAAIKRDYLPLRPNVPLPLSLVGRRHAAQAARDWADPTDVSGAPCGRSGWVPPSPVAKGVCMHFDNVFTCLVELSGAFRDCGFEQFYLMVCRML